MEKAAKRKRPQTGKLSDFCKTAVYKMVEKSAYEPPRVSAQFLQTLADRVESRFATAIDAISDLVSGAGRKTITIEDVLEVLDKYMGDSYDLPAYRCTRGTQKHDPITENCYYLAKASFYRFAKGVISYYGQLKTTSEAMEALQVYVERLLEKFIQLSIKAMRHDKRKTLMYNDIEFVVFTRKNNCLESADTTAWIYDDDHPATLARNNKPRFAVTSSL